MFGIDGQLLGGTIFAFVGGVGFVTELREMKQAIDSSAWPAVDGEVEETGVVSNLGSSGTMYAPVVRYHYRVGDRQHLSDRIAFGGVISSSFRSLAAKSAARYGQQKTVKVYVSPKDPTLSVLKPGLSWFCWFVLAFSAAFFGAGLQTLLAYFGIVGNAWIHFS